MRMFAHVLFLSELKRLAASSFKSIHHLCIAGQDMETFLFCTSVKSGDAVQITAPPPFPSLT